MSTRKKKIYKILALYLAFNLLAQVCWPTAAFALTNGPGQPEFQSFEPAGTTEMVNLFTGDFNYNIPLMTVPGPNGGYPINLAYHAGISMEQEASWVGLGWNINAGAINRDMRGLPDDFNDDIITKELHYKPSTSLSLSLGRSFLQATSKREIYGFSVNSFSLGVNLYYNNYRGLGFGYNFGLSPFYRSSPGASKYALPLSINLTSSSDGIGVNVGTVPSDNDNNGGWFPSVGLSWGSRDGITALSLGGGGQLKRKGFPIGAGISFAKSSYVPASNPEMAGLITMLGVSIGDDIAGDWSAKKITSLDASYNRSWVKFETSHPHSFGYLHAESSNAMDNENTLEDVNREKDAPPSRQTKTMGVPVATYDVYGVSGQGVGGSFRPYRSDLGIYTEPKTISTIYGGKLSMEFSIPDVEIKWGANLDYTQSQTYSGMWFNHFFVGNSTNDQGWGPLTSYKFQTGLPGGDHLYEPYYFKMSGEQTAAPDDQLDFMRGTSAVRFNLKEVFEGDDGGISVRPEIGSNNLYTDEQGDSPAPLTAAYRTTREKRVTSNQSYTNDQLERFTASEPANIYSTFNDFPATGGVASPAAFDYTAKPGHHIGAFTEVTADGNRYVYGIPVYTTSRNVVFAKDGLSEYPTEYAEQFTSTEASLNNEEYQTDQYFASTTTPGYASSYLLSAIYSPDYVDMTGDGPTEDDLGYYVKFNYVKNTELYKWRAPYWDAIVNSGLLSNQHDDKLSYEYGEKEIYELHSIETKTHVACFILQNDNRKDGHAAVDEHALNNSTYWPDVATAEGTRALDHIALYSKADPDYGTSNATPLKSVYFTYDYSLCSNVHNNENLHGSGEKGKLTLKSIYFTYRNNAKGQLSPYLFDYVDTSYDSDLQNPGYDPLGNDRWGSYKKQETGDLVRNNENPYVDQKASGRDRVDQSAAAWCLKKITLPSGSTINVNYESDDYAYVQNYKATQMCRMVGTLKFHEDNLSDVSDRIDPLHKVVCFELNKTFPYNASDAEIKKYIEGIEDLYFKVFVKLKPHFGTLSEDPAQDYVEGYCKISQEEGTYGFVDEGGTNPRHFGFFTLVLVDRDDYPNIPGAIKANPIQKAAWQYIYLERPDLFASPDLESGTVANLAVAATAMITELPRAVAPYMTAFTKGWAAKIDINTASSILPCVTRPSYVRLNNPDGVKAGGGHRVKSIVMEDNWNSLSLENGVNAQYGISYTYRLANGMSSGVAAYEPMIGGDEIALRKPIRYNSNNLVKKDAAFYVEEPMGESYFPAPVVGYSRVIVKSIVGNDNYDNQGAPALITKSRTGQTVYEFYTAKDYPVISDQTDLQKTSFPIPVFIPFIGSITYNNRGYSQGYSVMLNDMHGKLKSVSTYSSKDDLFTNPMPMPVRRVVYKYNDVITNRTSGTRQLVSVVNVLTADGVQEQAALGETYDFYTDMRQHSNETLDLGLQFNTNTNVTGFTLPIILPTINISKALFRSAVTMKVIYRTGILMEVETLDDGVRSKANNLLFDAETGAPLLTTVTNEFEKPVYTYNYAAHWAYEGMQGAYKNIGVSYSGTTDSNGWLSSITDAENIFFPGDEVMYIPATGPGEMLTVTEVAWAAVRLMNRDGSYAATLTGSFTIARSGHRNLQSVSNGVIVSLSDPSYYKKSTLLEALSAIPALETDYPYYYTNCNNETVGFTLTYEDYTLTITQIGDEPCVSTLVIPPGDTPINSIGQLHGCTFTLLDGGVLITFPDEGTLFCPSWEDCFPGCNMADVLHAASARFSDEWSASLSNGSQPINFADAGLTTDNVPTTHNPYVFGEKGVWRAQNNYLYQVDRKQTTSSVSSTDISRDGTYSRFVPYDWTKSAEQNTNWAFVSRINRYHPYGYMLETRDALGIYSASMYGYNNTKQTAAVSNAQYFEQGFDGFEDYPSNVYPEIIGTTTPAPWGHGHLLFNSTEMEAPPVLSSSHAHTGKYSLAVQANADAQYLYSSVNGIYTNDQQYFEPRINELYALSVWVWAPAGSAPSVEINNGSGTTSFTTNDAQSAIEGWKQINATFSVPTSGNTLTINLACQAGTVYFDDIRVQPFKSAMVSYVYDPQTHWLLAQLDNRNFATFYNYDEEGSVVQVKQETEKGISTIKTARSNIKR